ncbi:arylformamidase [Aspergillus ibericus CBS 121593]|uniref:Kynurenine formamidase n=1 Tax=Aspergillus ibericus CBS 121593 TaxID=1448316 RepID=A0A395GYD4_9EURO|nr:hypothetical protein BO80DRAFT_465494 [Aspergillus ibericus CBS 121593]RAL00360.1 hypothetical protein BO80DRAFT_465494 [Aspergillus ibericus CBS 121593]
MSTETFHYGTDHDLQTVTVTTLNTTTTTTTPGYWVILIHGGAWRDPTQTAHTYLTPTSTILTTSPPYTTTTTPYIHALASISYRLSAHPSHPQDPSVTDPTHLRTATHPDHITDILSALSFLQTKYSIGENYLLVGHSCGATLAFQSVMGKFRTDPSVPAPVGILGMAGIYDLRGLRDTHRDVSAYQAFTEGAFGKDEGVWDGVSPAVVRGEEGVVGGWKGGRVAVLAYSREDGLVDEGQREGMRRALGEWVALGGGKRVEGLEIRGQHDDAWREGGELARGIAFAIEKLRE